jgi:hypothetical protein
VELHLIKKRMLIATIKNFLNILVLKLFRINCPKAFSIKIFLWATVFSLVIHTFSFFLFNVYFTDYKLPLVHYPSIDFLGAVLTSADMVKSYNERLSSVTFTPGLSSYESVRKKIVGYLVQYKGLSGKWDTDTKRIPLRLNLENKISTDLARSSVFKRKKRANLVLNEGLLEIKGDLSAQDILYLPDIEQYLFGIPFNQQYFSAKFELYVSNTGRVIQENLLISTSEAYLDYLLRSFVSKIYFVPTKASLDNRRVLIIINHQINKNDFN